jgi:hypothetical protein
MGNPAGALLCTRRGFDITYYCCVLWLFLLQALVDAWAGSAAGKAAANQCTIYDVVVYLWLLLLQALVDAWAGSAAGKAAAEAAAAHKHLSRTPSGVLALGAVNAGPVAGWAR